MNTIIFYLLESSVCLGVFYLFYRSVLRTQTSYLYNRWYLLTTVALGLILPVLEIPLDFGGAAMNPVQGGYILLNPDNMSIDSSDNATFVWSWQLVFGGLYSFGVLVVGGYYIRQLVNIVGIIRRGKHQAKITSNYCLIYTDGQFPTASFLNYLLWDNTISLSSVEQQQIMAHEESHIRQKHSYDVLYITLLKTIFWFHPLMHLYDKALVENHEFAADAGALHHPNSDRKTYTSLLARQTVHPAAQLLVNHFHKSKTLKRIKMMEKHVKTPWYRLVLTIPTVLGLFFVFACQEESEMEKLDELQAEYDRAQTEEQQAQLGDADQVFMVVENQPTPEGGMEAFYDYIKTNLSYPAQARRMGIEGKVFVQFVVNTDGTLTDVEAIKGIGAGCDDEAVRVIREAMAWNPGEQRGKFVKVRMVMPVTFRLGGEPEVEADQLQTNPKKISVIHFSTEGNTLSGTLENEDGNPLAGANVLVRGTTIGTVTNQQGKFVVSHELAKENGLAISSIGYQPINIGNWEGSNP
ncbi:MAG: TonB family protein [Cyclobacteriaceae bacterium]